jgi:hypothetical protein
VEFEFAIPVNISPGTDTVNVGQKLSLTAVFQTHYSMFALKEILSAKLQPKNSSYKMSEALKDVLDFQA